MEIQLGEVSPVDRGLLTELLDQYLRELASHREIPAGATRAREYPYFDAYFSDAGRHAFLIREADRVTGFAFIRGPESTHRGWQVAELYVAPPRRLAGVGRAAIALIWSRFPGEWELQVHARNTEAIQFWTSCISAIAGRQPIVTRVDAADGTRLQFNFWIRETR
jgi:predicted acetyltransferase